jgi:hypothetical protein
MSISVVAKTFKFDNELSQIECSESSDEEEKTKKCPSYMFITERML